MKGRDHRVRLELFRWGAAGMAAPGLELGSARARRAGRILQSGRHLQVAQVILGNIELNITQYLIEY
jgi:hypothetical protein